MNNTWQVHKFGGTSVADASRYLHVTQIMQGLGNQQPKAIVVSAMSKVTDALIELCNLALKHDSTYLEKMEQLKTKHMAVVQELLPAPRADQLMVIINTDFNELADILRGIWLVKTFADRTYDWVSGMGEVWSAQILNALLNEQQPGSSCYLDAREVLVILPEENSVQILWEESQKKCMQFLAAKPDHTHTMVITGFVAATPEGVAATLKRNGSDYSASIFGNLLNASEITIWTDVDGVMSADPRLVPEAVVLDELSYHEAAELAYFGAKVVHPSTMAPAITKQIPIWIKNTFKPEVPGTKIHAHTTKPNITELAMGAKAQHLVKGFSTVNSIALFNIEGPGMVGIPGVAEKLFSALRSAKVSVVMISQASSEHSICFAIPQDQAEIAKQTLTKTFHYEISQGHISTVNVTRECSILAAVGDHMVNHPGMAGQFFMALGKAGINIRAIAQGSSERNISAVIDQQYASRALKAVHAAFFLSDQTLNVGIIGTGVIGSAFLKQLTEHSTQLKKEFHIDVRVRAIMNSKKMLLADPITLTRWQADLDKKGLLSSYEEFTEHLQHGSAPHTVLIDATSNQEIAQQYSAWLKRGINIITPNKKANSGPYSTYQELKALTRQINRYYLYSTTVGAGLPILHTLRELIQTGDRIHKIEGILSGTLSFLFNNFKPGDLFSQLLLSAKEQGYTEPDPRDDLSGTDVARKLVIIAREIGVPLELEQVEIENLVPATLQKLDLPEFMKRLPAIDAQMSEWVSKAHSQAQALRYVGSLEKVDGVWRAQCKIKNYSSEHPMARTSGTNNMLMIQSERYATQPMFIQGPGAGPEVTAGGVFADLLKLAHYVGTPL